MPWPSLASSGSRFAEKDVLPRGGLLHDIGKISIPDAILDKPGKLNEDEMRVIEQHPVQGVKIIEPLRSLHDVIPLVRWHHERLDGLGYPDQLQGDAIPLLVRILTVADIYDALSSNRPYRAAMPHAECLNILRKNAREGALDAGLVEKFCKLFSAHGKGTARDLISSARRTRNATCWKSFNHLHEISRWYGSPASSGARLTPASPSFTITSEGGSSEPVDRATITGIPTDMINVGRGTFTLAALALGASVVFSGTPVRAAQARTRRAGGPTSCFSSPTTSGPIRSTRWATR